MTFSRLVLLLYILYTFRANDLIRRAFNANALAKNGVGGGAFIGPTRILGLGPRIWKIAHSNDLCVCVCVFLFSPPIRSNGTHIATSKPIES